MKNQIVGIVVMSCLFGASSVLAQQVSSSAPADAPAKATRCSLEVVNKLGAPAKVGAADVEFVTVKSGSRTSLFVDCNVLQKTSLAYKGLVKKQSATSYSMTMVSAEPVEKAAPHKTPGVKPTAPAAAAAAVVLKADGVDYPLTVYAPAKICFDENC